MARRRVRVRMQRRIRVTTRQTVRRQTRITPMPPQASSSPSRASLPASSSPQSSRKVTRHFRTVSAPVREVAENLGDLIGDAPRDFDVFISHASEDKGDLVRPLATELRDAGLEVWYDEFELKLGDSLRRKIDAGIRQARFGIVVLSEAFFAKNWTQYELDGIVTAQVTGKQIILPLWHGVGHEEVFNFSPSLADKVAVDTATRSISELAADIVAVTRPDVTEVEAG